MTKKDKLNIVKAGVSAYAVSSLIAWLKEGGIKLVNQTDAYVIKIHKTMGVIDVFRPDSYLFNRLDVFGGDWIFVVVGMFSAVIAVGAMKAIQYFEDDGPKPKKTAKGYTVKIPNVKA